MLSLANHVDVRMKGECSMPDALLRIIEKVIDLAKGPLCAASGVLLVLYTLRVNAFELYTLLSSNIVYPAVIFILFIFSIVFFLCDILARFTKWLYKFNLKRNSRKTAYDKLRSYLTPQQKEVLRILVNSYDHSGYFVFSEHMRELETHDIILSRDIPLSESGFTHRGLEYYDKYLYTIQAWAFTYLRKYPELLETK